MLHALLLTLSLSSHTSGPIDITEQDLTSYVNQNARYQQQYGLPRFHAGPTWPTKSRYGCGSG